MINGADEPCEAFAYFCEHSYVDDNPDGQEVEAFFTAAQIQTLQKTFDDLLDGILNKLISKHLEKPDFYCELWKNIESDVLFEEEEQKMYALYRIWIDGRIPYFKIGDGLMMSDEEFKEIIDGAESLLRETAFILNCKFEQKTERSSVLLDVLNRCKDNKERAVVLAYIISTTEVKMLDVFGVRSE